MPQDRSLDNILNTGAKAKIMRLFTLRTGDFKASGRKVAALVNISAPTAHLALKELRGEGVLKREIIGKQHIYSLDADSVIVNNMLKLLFQKESSIKTQIGNHFVKQAQNKNIYIIAGSNGSGKTTFARTFLPEYVKCLHFINSDLIAKGLSPFSPPAFAMKAGRLVLEQMNDLAEKGAEFGFETTLSGKFYINRLKNLKKMGYALHLFFLWIPSTELAIARIKDRVSEGGHHVPARDVRRRFSRGITNFFKFYRPLLDSWILLDNSSVMPGLIAKEKGSQLAIANEGLFGEITKNAG